MQLENRLYLSPPYICGREQEYIAKAFAQNWIAPLGPNVTAFEKALAARCHMPYAVATDSGTAAIHLALRYLGVGRGDRVFCSDFTFAASCNPILYLDAEPVFIDSDPESWNMSPVALEKAFIAAKEEGKMPKAVIIVDLYGLSANYDALLPICKKYAVPVIEDAAEALGSVYHGQPCGSFGDMSILSFNGNKIVTTSGGGMLFCKDEAAAKKALFWATQARENAPHYEHKEFGYNYRLSNVSAGIGLGQLEQLEHKIEKRKANFLRYQEAFLGKGIAMMPIPSAEKGSVNYWMTVIYMPEKVKPVDVWRALDEANIESRPAWKPMHMQPLYQQAPFFSHYDDKSFSEEVFAHGLCLPSGEAMSEEQQNLVIEIVLSECEHAS